VVKKPIVDSGILSDSEIGMIGSALFFAYAIGKLTMDFLLIEAIFVVLWLQFIINSAYQFSIGFYNVVYSFRYFMGS
jgi:OPA family sugar phosphate sensor protein UhpC-like MFS transporter